MTSNQIAYARALNEQDRLSAEKQHWQNQDQAAIDKNMTDISRAASTNLHERTMEELKRQELGLSGAKTGNELVKVVWDIIKAFI